MTAALGAISTKGREPLRWYGEGLMRRRHHHPDGTRCADLRDRAPEPEPTCPPPAPAWLTAPVTDPALGER